MLKRNDLFVSIYADAILHNVGQLKSCCGKDVKFCAVVKANAYGHGIIEVVKLLVDGAVDFFAVANIYEAFLIEPYTNGSKILVFEPVYPGQEKELITGAAERGLHCTVSSLESVTYAESVLSGTDLRLNLHVNVNTGMGRYGADDEKLSLLLDNINQSGQLELAGIYTHFAGADEQDLCSAKGQLKRFKQLLNLNAEKIGAGTIVHAANSAATIQLKESHFDMVRCGISLYGYSLIEGQSPVDLRGALKLQVPISYITDLKKGDAVSYNGTFVAGRDTRIAVLPIGYSDNFCRLFSNKAVVRIGEKFAPVIGRVTMNGTVIDVTDIEGVRCGQKVTVIDNKTDSRCGVYTLAKQRETICHEVLTSVPSWSQVCVCDRL